VRLGFGSRGVRRAERYDPAGQERRLSFEARFECSRITLPEAGRIAADYTSAASASKSGR
jgi:hypothetical protein